MKIQLTIRTVEALFLILFVLFGSGIASAQIRKPPVTKKPVAAPVKSIEFVKPAERPVTIALKEGEPVSGKFVNASSEGVQIVIAGNTLILKWFDIGKIVFTDVVSSEPVIVPEIKPEPKEVEPKKNEAVDNALRSLRKLAAATEVGVNFQDYGKRLIDVKVEVEEFLANIPDGYVKTEINNAMTAYVDAGTSWNEMIRYDFMMVKHPLGGQMQSKYAIPMDRTLRESVVRRDVVLSTIWGAARTHINNAAKGESPK